jgi:1,4-alpha-glucan branching enzyme
MNETVASLYPNTLMIAEDSSQWPLVTSPTSSGGLGFNYKWNMGWMNDTLKYCSMDPIYRKWNHNLLTFSLSYAFSENYILPLSHDEVVHGKHSLLDKMPGDYSQKFSGLRSLYGYMAAHPGKKLTFMGGEFGQFIEWKYEDKLDWLLLEYEMHRKMKDYVKALNHFYQNNPCLWEDDDGWSGFQWISPDDTNQSIVAFMRRSRTPGDYLLVVVNFTPVYRPQYRMGVPKAEGFIEIFNSDDQNFGGSGNVCGQMITLEDIPCHNYEQSITLQVPPLAAVFYKPVK